jgi:hypothetical protein
MEATHEIQPDTIEPDSVPSNDYKHSVYLPISKEIMEELQVDDIIHIKFQGKVRELSSGYNDSDDYSLSVSVSRVTVATENEFEKLSLDDDE